MKITTYSMLAEMNFTCCLIVYANEDVQVVIDRNLNAINNLDSVKLEIGDHGNNKQLIKLEHTTCESSSCREVACNDDYSQYELSINLVFDCYVVVYAGEEVGNVIEHLIQQINHPHHAKLLLANGEGNSQTIKIEIVDCEDLDCVASYSGNVA